MNLDGLKDQILGHLETAGFAVFHGSANGLETAPSVSWDVDRYPDYRMFFDAAKKVGAAMIVFSDREFESDEIDEAIEELNAAEFSREERRSIERRLEELRGYEGFTCSLELGFDYHARFYVFEMFSEWYEEFLNLLDEIGAHAPDDEEETSMGGYFSNN
ncbi:MAG: hypothetical protein WD696_19170 [Bryobacteraceae bacterium]